MTRFLVTGAQGFAGRYLVAHLMDDESVESVVGIGRSPRDDGAFTHRIRHNQHSVPAPLPDRLASTARHERYEYRSADLLDTAALTAAIADAAPTHIVHLASGLRDHPTEFLLRTNVAGTEALYAAVPTAGIAAPFIVIGSSGSVYGPARDADLPLRETLPAAPFDMYSITKLAQENVARMMAARHGVPTVIARIFAIVGPGQDERHVCGRIASQLTSLESVAEAGQISMGPLTATRDFVDVRDVAASLSCVARRGAARAIYNIGSGRETAVQDVFDTLLSLARLPAAPAVTRLPARPLDLKRNVADIARLTALGAPPPRPLRDSLADLLEYYRRLPEPAAAG